MHIKTNLKSSVASAALIALSICLLSSTSTQGQSFGEIHPELLAGVSMPIGKEFSHVHSAGLNVGSNVFLSLNEKVSIGPCLSFQYHTKNINEGAKDVFMGTGFGLVAEYAIPVAGNKLTLYPQAGVMCQSVSDRISARKGYRGEKIMVLKGSGAAFNVGGALQLGSIRLTLRYTLFNAPVNFDEGLFSDLAENNVYYTIFTKEEPGRMDLSSLSIQLGYRFWD